MSTVESADLSDGKSEVFQQHDFTFIDVDAAKQRAKVKSNKSKISGLATAKRIAKDRWDKFHLSTSRTSFIALKIVDGQLLFDSGDFKSALEVYLNLYKVMEDTDNRSADPNYFVCLLRLGCCYKALDAPSHANNFFRLAIQSATNLRTSTRAVLYLASSRYQAGDESGALRVMVERIKEADYLPEVITTELPYRLLDQVPLFQILIDFGKQSSKTGGTELAADAAKSAWIVFLQLLKTQTRASTDDLLNRLLELLAGIKNKDMVRGTYTAIADYFGSSKRGVVAFLTSILIAQQDAADADPARVDFAISTVAQTKLSIEDLALLKNSVLSLISPKQCRDIFVRLSKAYRKGDFIDTAFDTMKIACQLTSEHRLMLTEDFVTELDALDGDDSVLCLEMILQDPQFLKYLVIYFGNTGRFKHISKIANLLVQKNESKQLAHLFSIVKYGCPDPVFKAVCDCADLLHHTVEMITSVLDQNIDTLANELESPDGMFRIFSDETEESTRGT